MVCNATIGNCSCPTSPSGGVPGLFGDTSYCFNTAVTQPRQTGFGKAIIGRDGLVVTATYMFVIDISAPVISGRSLALFFCLDAACSQTTRTIVFNQTGWDLTVGPIISGEHLSLDVEIGANGFPTIAFESCEKNTTDVLCRPAVLVCQDQFCETRQISILALPGFTPDPSYMFESKTIEGMALEIDSHGNPVIAFSKSKQLYVMFCTDPACTNLNATKTSISTADYKMFSSSQGIYPHYVTLALAPGDIPVFLATSSSTATELLVNYYSGSGILLYNFLDLFLFRCSDARCSGVTNTTLTQHCSGIHPSLAVDPISGDIFAAYSSDRQLTFAACNLTSSSGLNCAKKVFTTLTNTNTVGVAGFTQISLTSKRLPFIATVDRDFANSQFADHIRVIPCADRLCTQFSVHEASPTFAAFSKSYVTMVLNAQDRPILSILGTIMNARFLSIA